MNDLSQGIALFQEALLLCPAGHPARPLSLKSLAAVLLFRCQLEGQEDLDDLNQAILLFQEMFDSQSLDYHTFNRRH